MPRNGSGTYTLPQSAFVSGTTISSAAMNSDLSDIASALTGSVSADGQTPLTGVFKNISGTISAPSVSFTSDTTSGLFLSATKILGAAAGGFAILVNGNGVAASGAPTVSAGGSGYAVGDQITLNSGGLNPVVVQVATLSGSAVATVTLVEAGRALTAPSNPVAQSSTTGSGTNATFTVSWSSALALTDGSSSTLWGALGGTSFFATNIAKANSIAGFLGAQAVTAYNLNANALNMAPATNMSLTATVNAGALTVALKNAAGTDPTTTSPVTVIYRDSTVANGGPIFLQTTSALSIVAPVGSTFGVANTTTPTTSTAFRLYVVMFNNSSTPVLGLWQSTGMSSFALSGSVNTLQITSRSTIDESTPASSSAIASATSAGVFYTTSAVTSKSFRILGVIEFNTGQATAGTYNTAPSKITLFGPGTKKSGEQIQLFTTTTTTVVNATISSAGIASAVASITPILSSSGGQFMSQQITPAFPGNVLEVEVQAVVAAASTAAYGVALFQDPAATGTPALTATGGPANVVPGVPNNVSLKYQVIAGSTSPTTLKVFGEPSVNMILSLNGSNGGLTNTANVTAIMNGTQANSYISVKEIQS